MNASNGGARRKRVKLSWNILSTDLRCEFPTSLTMNSTMFWDVKPCDLVEAFLSFGKAQLFHLHIAQNLTLLASFLVGLTLLL